MTSYSMDILLVDNSLREFYDIKKNYQSDAGFDLYVPETITFRPGETKIVDLKVKCRCRNDFTNVSYYMYPRSSISKTPLTMCNSVGIIDADYRGNLMVALRYNIDKSVLMDWSNLILDNKDKSFDFDTEYDKLPVYELERGTRIVQLISPSLSPFTVHFVDKLDDTKRGDGGFGSTGK
jgi:dUTP pyrophosphatase